ncbi:MAG TPA: ester cyclase [Acidimicrobiales bacterium]|nr:ester cyclase [Acidimicrobiales bacterium]
MSSDADVVTAEREEVLRRHLDAERSGDPEMILGTFAHPRYELVGSGRVYDGTDEVRTYLVERAHAFPDLATEVISFWHSPEVVSSELWLSGVYRGPVPDLGVEGRRFRVRTACFFLFDERGLIGVRAYFDSGALARQLA